MFTCCARKHHLQNFDYGNKHLKFKATMGPILKISCNFCGLESIFQSLNLRNNIAVQFKTNAFSSTSCYYHGLNFKTIIISILNGDTTNKKQLSRTENYRDFQELPPTSFMIIFFGRVMSARKLSEKIHGLFLGNLS